jgi:hypothetical protein
MEELLVFFAAGGRWGGGPDPFQVQLPEIHSTLSTSQIFGDKARYVSQAPSLSHAHSRVRPGRRACVPVPAGLSADLLEEVSLPGGCEGHLPAGAARRSRGRTAGGGAHAAARDSPLRPRPAAGTRATSASRLAGHRWAAATGVAARGVGAGLARVRAGVRLLEEGLGQDLLPPRAGLGVHDRVEEGHEVRVQVLRDVDHLLPRWREWRGHGGWVHLLPGDGVGCFFQIRGWVRGRRRASGPSASQARGACNESVSRSSGA